VTGRKRRKLLDYLKELRGLTHLKGKEEEVTGRRGRRRGKLLDYLKELRELTHLKEIALDRTVWRARFGRSFGPVVRDCQINE
jgi:hypothetical protein